MKVFEILNALEKHNGLYPIHINPISGKFQKETTWRERWKAAIWGSERERNNSLLLFSFYCINFMKLDYYTLGGKADSFYEYLLKVWILTGKTDEMYLLNILVI